MLYGFSTVALYEVLGRAGLPTFYDKLLQVPLLNLSVKGIDGARAIEVLRHSIRRRSVDRLRRIRVTWLYISLWAIVFGAMSARQGRRRQSSWPVAAVLAAGLPGGARYACPYLTNVQASFCDRGSGWACNDAGLMHVALARSGEDSRRLDPAGAAEPFRRGCELGVVTACRNLSALTGGGGEFAAAAPTVQDFPIILRGSKGEIREREPAALYAPRLPRGLARYLWPLRVRSHGLGFVLWLAKTPLIIII